VSSLLLMQTKHICMISHLLHCADPLSFNRAVSHKQSRQTCEAQQKINSSVLVEEDVWCILHKL